MFDYRGLAGYARRAVLIRHLRDHHHEIDGGGNAGLIDRWGLREFLLDRFAIAGTPDDCVAQLLRAMAAGAHQFVITGFVPDPHAFMSRWMREVATGVNQRSEVPT